jgi:hypothetical protein
LRACTRAVPGRSAHDHSAGVARPGDGLIGSVGVPPTRRSGSVGRDWKRRCSGTAAASFGDMPAITECGPARTLTNVGRRCRGVLDSVPTCLSPCLKWPPSPVSHVAVIRQSVSRRLPDPRRRGPDPAGSSRQAQSARLLCLPSKKVSEPCDKEHQGDYRQAADDRERNPGVQPRALSRVAQPVAGPRAVESPGFRRRCSERP